MYEQPPFWSAIAATALLSGFTGYYMASLFSLNISTSHSRSAQSLAVSEAEEDGESEDEGPGPIAPLPASNEEHKVVLVVRTDLSMGKGKIAAQCGHATLACYKRAQQCMPKTVSTWERHGQAKIALKCASEDDMLLLQATAISLGLVAEIIHDAGRTQIAAGSATVLGIGPGPKSLINQAPLNVTFPKAYKELHDRMAQRIRHGSLPEYTPQMARNRQTAVLAK